MWADFGCGSGGAAVGAEGPARVPSARKKLLPPAMLIRTLAHEVSDTQPR